MGERTSRPLGQVCVEKHLCGKYEVRILADNLTSDAAEDLEADFIAQCGDTLVNWINFSRSFDYQAIDQYHKLRNANRSLMQKAKALERDNPQAAAELYVKAIEATKEYAFINYEKKGLVGQIRQEEAEELGRAGEIEALNRLTMCLIKLGMVQEAAERAVSYFSLYHVDLSGTVSESITKRIEKAFARAQKYADRDKFREMLSEMKKTRVKTRANQLADMG